MFLLPKSFCKELQQLMACFLWSSDIEARKIHWMSWDRMCKPKEDGDWVFTIFTRLISHFWWNRFGALCSNKRHLLLMFWKQNTSLMVLFRMMMPLLWHFTHKKVSWRHVSCLKVVRVRLLVDGESVQVWKDRWIPKPNTFEILTTASPSTELIMQDTRSLQIEMLL